MKLKLAQRNKLSDFANMLAVAWFTAGVISPLFLQTDNLNKTISLALIALVATGFFVYWSLFLVRKVRL